MSELLNMIEIGRNTIAKYGTVNDEQSAYVWLSADDFELMKQLKSLDDKMVFLKAVAL